MASCRAQVDATPQQASEWLNTRRSDWLTRCESLRMAHRADRTEENAEAYRAALTQLDRYEELVMIYGRSVEELVIGRIEEIMENWEKNGLPARPKQAEVYKQVTEGLTIADVVELAGNLDARTRQGLESALRMACPYDPLDDLPCTKCGHDEVTL